MDGKSTIFNKFTDGPELGCEKALRSIKTILYGQHGNSVIHTAVNELAHNKVKQILSHDISRLYEVNSTGQNPLIIACTKNDYEMVNILLESYTKNPQHINSQLQGGRHILHIVTSMNPIDDKIIRNILEFPGIEVGAESHPEKLTPLHCFCINTCSLDCSTIGNLFIKLGANPNSLTADNQSPLHKAVSNPKVSLALVQMLLRANANPNVRNGDGDTPLILAIKLRRKDIIECLLKESDLDIELTNHQGFSPLQLVTQEYEYVHDTEKPILAAIKDTIQAVIAFQQLLLKIELRDVYRTFMSLGWYEPAVLCSLKEEQLVDILKLGARMKLTKEIEGMKQAMDEKMLAGASSNPGTGTESNPRILKKRHIDTEAAFLSTIDLENGKWRIETDEIKFVEKLGTGASGPVFRGYYRTTKPVALKILTKSSNFESQLIDFSREIEILKRVNHPNLIHFYGAVIGKELIMVMELCQRGSLHDLMAYTKGFSLDWKQAIQFMKDMSHGLLALHDHDPPIIHRDLKSPNLLITSDWCLKICDFGLSRLVQGDNLKTFLKICGTYAYIAPEILNGKPATQQSDVYSMGIVIWEIIYFVVTGSYSQPYHEYGFQDLQILVQAANGVKPTLPPNTPLEFVNLFNVCVGPPEQRPTAKGLCLLIQNLKGDATSTDGSDVFDKKRKISSQPSLRKATSQREWRNKSAGQPVVVLDPLLLHRHPHSVDELHPHPPAARQTPRSDPGSEVQPQPKSVDNVVAQIMRKLRSHSEENLRLPSKTRKQPPSPKSPDGSSPPDTSPRSGPKRSISPNSSFKEEKRKSTKKITQPKKSSSEECKTGALEKKGSSSELTVRKVSEPVVQHGGEPLQLPMLKKSLSTHLSEGEPTDSSDK